MDKFSYAIGLGIGQNLLSMGAQGINVNDFAQAIKDVLDGKETAISHNEAREKVLLIPFQKILHGQPIP